VLKTKGWDERRKEVEGKKGIKFSWGEKNPENVITSNIRAE